MNQLLAETNKQPYQTTLCLKWRAQVRYPWGTSMCYKCHLPFFNGRLRPAKSDNIEGCNALYNNMVALLVWAMYMVKDHRERLKK